MESVPPEELSNSFRRAWYGASVADFVRGNANLVLGRLTANCDFSLTPAQRNAWLSEIEILRSSLCGIDGTICLEFNIPRMGRRIDAVLLTGPIVFVMEFKVGAKDFDRAGFEQVWDYALDLKNFHQASHAVPILPMLVATEAPTTRPPELRADADQVYRPVQIDPGSIRAAIDRALVTIKGSAINATHWIQSPYLPTPTIVEAARALYAQHSVEAIARYDAGAKNLRLTSCRVEQLVDYARTNNRKIVCFVTGVPGAGKTLVGLNVATQRRDTKQSTHAVFLSGNGPLVAVLREALTRDEVNRRKSQGEKVRKGKVGESVKAFIQNVHHFRDDAIADARPPVEHVAIFDEAQRAWDCEKTASFMRQKRKLSGFSQSEPQFLISCLDRHRDWAVVICLVGGGQEIHTGEAGIGAWLDAVVGSFPSWDVHISSKLIDSEYAAGGAIEKIQRRENSQFDDTLHLAVPMRSFRAENVSAFIKAVLDCESKGARESFAKFAARYPIALTRDLNLAKRWVRDHARGSERFGMVASSRAQRLKPHAIDVRAAVDPVHWFLNEKEDTRSSFYLEDAATEFDVQGLELDWTCVTWDGDMRFTGVGWSYHDFRGDRWNSIRDSQRQVYVRNAYRVLLTRARQGMVVFVPPGDASDPTRNPAYYDTTFKYLVDLGIPILI